MTVPLLNMMILTIWVVISLWAMQSLYHEIRCLRATLKGMWDTLELVKKHTQVNARQIDLTQRESLETRKTVEDAVESGLAGLKR